MENTDISKLIIKNRIKEEKSLAKNYAITPELMAEYFQVPTRIIDRELQENKIEITGTKKFRMNLQKKRIQEVVDLLEKDGMSKEEVLASYGLWTDIVVFGENNKKISGFDKDASKRIHKGIEMSEYGFGQQDVKNNLGANKLEMTYIRNSAEDPFNIKKFAKGDQFLFADRRKAAGDDKRDISQASGVKLEYVEKGKDYYEEYRKQYQKEYQKNKGVSTGKNSRYTDKEKLDIVNEWRDGRNGTQQEIAEKYGVTRVTIRNWSRSFIVAGIIKMEKGDTDHTKIRIGRQRNLQKAVREAKDEKFQKIVDTYLKYVDQGCSNSKAINKTVEELYPEKKKAANGGYVRYSYITDVLRREGIIKTTKFDFPVGAKSIPEAAEDFKNFYKSGDLKKLVGYGYNAGKSKDIHSYNKIRSNQKNVEWEIRNQEKMPEYIRENDGDISEWWDEKKKIKAAEESAGEKKKEKNTGIEILPDEAAISMEGANMRNNNTADAVVSKNYKDTSYIRTMSVVKDPETKVFADWFLKTTVIQEMSNEDLWKTDPDFVGRAQNRCPNLCQIREQSPEVFESMLDNLSNSQLMYVEQVLSAYDRGNIKIAQEFAMDRIDLKMKIAKDPSMDILKAVAGVDAIKTIAFWKELGEDVYPTKNMIRDLQEFDAVSKTPVVVKQQGQPKEQPAKRGPGRPRKTPTLPQTDEIIFGKKEEKPKSRKKEAEKSVEDNDKER